MTRLAGLLLALAVQANAAAAAVEVFRPEELRYTLKWWVLGAGELSLSVERDAKRDGHDALHLTYVVKSGGLAGKLFHVDDRIDSYVDPTTRCSIAIEKHLHRSRGPESSVVDTAALGCVQDILSALYAIRAKDPLTVGTSFDVTTFDRGERYQMPVNVLKRERITIGLGSYEAVVVEPQPRFGGVFRKGGKLRIWIEDAPTRLPLLVKSKVSVGTLTAELRSVRRAE